MQPELQPDRPQSPRWGYPLGQKEEPINIKAKHRTVCWCEKSRNIRLTGLMAEGEDLEQVAFKWLN